MRALFFLLLQLMLVATGFAQKPRLFVFLPSNVRPHSMEKTVIEACGDLQVQVFGRHREMKKAIETMSPDAILVPQPIADTTDYASFSKSLIGSRDSKADEEYVLLSVQKQVDLNSIDNLAIGVVDLMSRSKLRTFITDKLGKKPRRVVPVTRLEDLLSLLQFRDVDAVFVSRQRVTDYYMRRSRMQLVITELKGVRVGLPVLAVNTTDPDKLNRLRGCLQGFKDEVNAKIGVDQWKDP